MNIVAVITAPYFSKSTASIDLAITEVTQLGVSGIIVVYDRKGSSGQHARAAVAGVQMARTLEVDESDTTLRTRWGIQEGFRDPTVEAVIVFPGDIDPAHPPSDENRRGWQEMFRQAATNRIAVGDFRSRRNSFKERFDWELIGLPALEEFFPEEAHKIRVVGLRKLRSEFYVLGRGVFEFFMTRGVAWSMDLTTDFVLAAVSGPGLECVPVDLGEIHDDEDQRRNPLAPMSQMLRFVAQLALQRIRLDRAKGIPDHLAVYSELRNRVKRSLDKCVVAIDLYRCQIDPAMATRRSEVLGSNAFNANQKIELLYQWARFAGFSYLLDPPAGDLEPYLGGVRICVRRGSSALLDSLDDLISGSWGEMLVRTYLLCRLPFSSYHVTWKDGFNVENLRLLYAEPETEFRSFLEALPESLLTGCPNLPPHSFDLGIAEGQALRFQFREFCIWSRSAFVARLKPADDETRELLRRAEQKRVEMSSDWARHYGLPAPDKHEKFVPHVSLGYLPNPDLAAPAEALLPVWSQTAARDLAGTTVEYRSASLYCFTSMADFFKVEPGGES